MITEMDHYKMDFLGEMTSG